MAALIAWLKGEPALVGAFVTIATTLAVSIPAQQGVLGAILSAVQALLAVGVRSQVSPVVPAPVVHPFEVPPV